MTTICFRNLVMVAGIVLATITVSCTNDVNKVFQLHNTQEVPSLRIVHLDGYITENGVITAEFSTPLMMQYDKVDNKYTDFPQGINLKKYNDSMVLEASIVADKAKNYETTKLWEIQGNVKVKNAKGEQLETELLYWDQGKKQIYTDAPVRITNNDAVINGVGLVSDETFENYEILKISNSVIYVDDTKTNP